MKSYLWILGVAASLALLSGGSAFGQCRGGGGQRASQATAAVTTGGTSVGTAQLLTGPGSWQYDVLMQQQLQQALARQQQAIALQKAKKAQAKFEKRLANAQKHRAEAAYKREVEIAKRSNALASQ